MSRIALSIVVALALAGLPACGGGGGGGGGDNTPTLPGDLVALAIQGQAAPGGGTYDALPVTPLMDAALNGWVAFVAPVGGTNTLFVAQPDGVVVRVLAAGDVSPEAPNGEEIEDFLCVWMCDNGTVIAYVDLDEDQPSDRDFALVSAIVDNGIVSLANGIIYEDDTTTGIPNGLTDVDADTGLVAACRLFILLKDEDALEDAADDDWVLVGIDADGANPLGYMREGAPILAQTITSIDGFGASYDAAGLGIAATLSSDGQGIFSTPADVVSLNRIAQAGDSTYIGNTAEASLQDVYKNGSPILVFPNGDMLWIGFGPLASPDQLIIFFDVSNGNPIQQLGRSGDDAPGTVSGSLSTIDLLHQRVDDGVSFPMLLTGITGDPQINLSIYAIPGGSGVFRYLFDGREFTPGVTWNGDLPGLRAPKFRDGDRTSSFAFRDTLTGGANPSGIFWGFTSTFTPLAVALEGDPTPDETDTFGSFISGAHTVAQGVLVFRANLATAGSAIFRQGP